MEYLLKHISVMEKIEFSDINLYDIGNSIQIAGTIWSGKGQTFVTLLPENTEDFSNLKLLPMTLEQWELFIRQTDLLETEIIQAGPQGVTKALVRKSQRHVDAYIQWAVFKRDDYTCRYCGRNGLPLSVDHIDLWEDGGATIIENLITACRKCNKDRGRMNYEEWINSSLYKRKSVDLPPRIIKMNIDILNELEDLKTKRVLNVRSR